MAVCIRQHLLAVSRAQDLEERLVKALQEIKKLNKEIEELKEQNASKP